MQKPTRLEREGLTSGSLDVIFLNSDVKNFMKGGAMFITEAMVRNIW